MRVSVIIPVYGVEAYLSSCLDSVLAQSLKDIEVICIDDASPDNCPQILDEYAAKDPRVRVVHLPENRRQGHGRNVGLGMAQGTYVYFLDADDLIFETALQELCDCADADNLDAIFFDSQVVFESQDLESRFGGYLGMRRGDYPNGVVTGKELFDAFVLQDEWLVLVQREFWRRDYLFSEGIRFPEDAEHEDQFFSIAGLLAARRVRYLRKPYFIRRYRDDSVVTSNPAPKNFHGYFVNMHMMCEFLTQRDIGGEAVDKVMHNMASVMESYHPVFRDAGCGVGWFSQHHLEADYLMYSYLARKKAFEEEFWSPLNSYSSIIVYGAGKVGQSVVRRLGALGLFVDSFVVSNPDEQPARVMRRNVIGVDELEVPEDGIVLVAMGAEKHASVSAILSKKGIRHFLYARNVLQGPIE